MLLALSQTIISHRELPVLMKELACELRKVATFDYLAIVLCDEPSNSLAAHILEPSEFAEEARKVKATIDGSPAGYAWKTQEPLVIDDIAAETRWPEFFQGTKQFGVQSTCDLPLTTARQKLGTLVFASKLPKAFSQQDVEFLKLVSSHVAIAVENALAFQEIEGLKKQLEQEKSYLEEEFRSDHNFGEIVGENAELRKVLKHVETVAVTDSTVLIYGETGTGKELIARGVHDRSPRHGRTFIKLNCAAIPTGLLESELFGHEKGAFTGAVNQKVGRFELADGGTLFLDEIGDIPSELQPKLLRVLQEQEFERLGGTKTIKVNVRVISATHHDLQEMVNQGEFRSDLFYRLNVFPISLPPLRERADDIPRLIRYFTQLFSKRMGRSIETIPANVIEHLCQYSWPGNIRELQNVIERAVILSPGKQLQVAIQELSLATKVESQPDATSESDDQTPLATATSEPDAQTLADAEREHILNALQRAQWVVGGDNGAAALLGLKRTTLQKKMKKLGIERPN
ncbi:sigma 54-interacting transcriptional regulator [Planctomycetaceae bacterium SH139]